MTDKSSPLAVKLGISSPARVTYGELLDLFWRHIDPTDPGGQFVDRGPYYRSAIFPKNEHQRKLAEASKKVLLGQGKFKKPIVTEIIPFSNFFPAEDYHQDYYKTHPARYKSYRSHSGRDRFLKKIWRDHMDNVRKDHQKVYGKPSAKEIKQMLTPLQYHVTQEEGTERSFDNEYWDNKQEGIYVDIVSGEPLFSSLDKFASGTGWPSFTKPLVPEHIIEKKDKSLFTSRTEVRSKDGDSHLGHVFNDGPHPTGQRYCINSASLRFISAEDLKEKGYEPYVKIFE